jgi:predicted transcriptional regulator
MAKKQKTEREKLIKSILKKTEITRSEANYLIKTALGLTVVEFSKLAGLPYRHLNDSLIALRPFSQELQSKIISYCNLNYKN